MALLAPSTALADVPPELVTAEFEAPACAGSTEFPGDLDDPATPDDESTADYVVNPAENWWGPVPNLLMVFDGAPENPLISRLEAYNNGAIVPLHDAYGTSDITLSVPDPDDPMDTPRATAAYPPICATRYVASEAGPVSEWMFCTDYTSHSCADVDQDGFGIFIDKQGQPQPLATATTPTGSRNSRLTAGQQKLIAFLIQHGHRYEGVGYYGPSGGFLPAGGFANTDSTRSRTSLQALIWCVSDYNYYKDYPPERIGSGPQFDATCDASGLSPAGQAALIAAIPDNPVLTLVVNASSGKVPPGSTARVRVTSNVFAQPLTVTSDLPVTVCSGPGTLVGDQLSIAGTDAEVPNVVELCATAPESGEVTVSVSVVPATTEHIGWNQATTGIDGELCQVFATFYTDQAVTLTGLTTLAIGEDEELAVTGAVVAPWALLLAAFGLLGAGAVFSRRRAAVR